MDDEKRVSERDQRCSLCVITCFLQNRAGGFQCWHWFLQSEIQQTYTIMQYQSQLICLPLTTLHNKSFSLSVLHAISKSEVIFFLYHSKYYFCNTRKRIPLSWPCVFFFSFLFICCCFLFSFVIFCFIFQPLLLISCLFSIWLFFFKSPLIVIYVYFLLFGGGSILLVSYVYSLFCYF